MSEFEKEKKHLEDVKTELKASKAHYLKKLEDLDNNKAIDPDLAESLALTYLKALDNIERHADSPYFAKLIYKDEDEPQDEELYIGKVGFADRQNKRIVIDWRAPISSLYYDSEVGKVNYVAPGGVMSGDLKLKRQIVIENSHLKEYNDSDLLTNDELLKPYLDKASDKRLRSIVATIQSEQNKIIRAPRSNMIIQGVAGSGKTTVALHRLSYLIYQMKKNDASKEFLIIGPNKIFLNYISSVLPELDTGNVTQMTYEELAKEIIGEKFKILDKNTTLRNLSEGIPAPKYLKIKTSKEYKKLLDVFLGEIDKSLLPKSVTYKGVELYSRDELYSFYKVVKTGNIKYDFEKLSEYIVGRLAIEPRGEELLNKLMSRADEAGIKISLKEKWDLQKSFDRKNASLFKKQINVGKISILQLYKSFVETLKNVSGYEELAEKTLENLNKKALIPPFMSIDQEVDFEDLGALVYLKQKVSENKKFKNISHVVVDEAQDLGLLHFCGLKLALNNAVTDLYGDLNQAIYGYSSIDNWQEVVDEVLDSKCNYQELKKSYRTTVEIMEAANLVSNSANIVKGTPVIRHGDQVYITEYNANNYIKTLTNLVLSESEKYGNVAIICKNLKECAYVSQMLKKQNISNTILQGDQEQKINGVMVLTVQDSKGLEFDSVILNDASEYKYDKNNVVDMKLLYVAMTRAMHNMNVLSNGKVVETLKSLPSKTEMKLGNQALERQFNKL